MTRPPYGAGVTRWELRLAAENSQPRSERVLKAYSRVTGGDDNAPGMRMHKAPF